MPLAHDALDAAISEIDRLRRVLKKGSNRQVRSSEEQALVKATCITWVRNHRTAVQSSVDSSLLEGIDAQYNQLLAASDKATTRAKYDQMIKQLRRDLAALRPHTLAPPAKLQATGEQPPSFAPLVPDPAMQSILVRRWQECGTCIRAGAPLAATVMMGGLLESLLLARVHRETDKNRAFRAKSTPIDKNTGKALQLQQWTLKNYLDVAHELAWITASAKDVGAVVRDYRNYIHPFKELSHGVQISDEDATLMWEVCKGIARQILGRSGT